MNNDPFAPPPPSPPNPYGVPPSNPYANQNPYANPQANAPYNPYAPPSAHAEYGYGGPAQQVDSEDMLAERGTRLGAKIVDNVLYAGAGAVGLIPGAAFDETVMVGFAGLTILALAIFQWYLIATTGQSLAKKWLGIRIVRLDGSQPGFLYGVVLRNWVIQAISALIGLVGLIDALLIFGDERRCLHDHIAGTKVVVAHS